MNPEKLDGIRRRVREWDLARVFADRADLLAEVDILRSERDNLSALLTNATRQLNQEGK